MNMIKILKRIFCLATVSVIAAGVNEFPAYAANKKSNSETANNASKYADTGISVANKYVNIRKEPNTQSEIVGKLYKGSAVTIISTQGDWVQVQSNGLEGYINREYLAIGYDAEKLVSKYKSKYAKVTVSKLKLRQKMSTRSSVLAFLTKNSSYKILKENKEWVRIQLDDKTTGYASKQYITVVVKMEGAIANRDGLKQKKTETFATKEIKAEETVQKTASMEAGRGSANDTISTMDAIVGADAVKTADNINSTISSEYINNVSIATDATIAANASTAANINTTTNASTMANINTVANNTVSTSDTASSNLAKGSQVAAYALQFVGNPYVWGGNSLTDGADCSGFVMSVYKNFGYSLSRTSKEQSVNGVEVLLDNVQPGDLVFYAREGVVYHVAIYIGNGQIVHACNSTLGIIVSSINYCPPYCARRILV